MEEELSENFDYTQCNTCKEWNIFNSEKGGLAFEEAKEREYTHKCV